VAAILKMRAAPPPPSAARGKLAAAIADLQKAEAEISAISQVLNTGACGWEATRAAQERVETAKVNLVAAKQGAADRLMQTALGDTETAAPDIKAARAALADAEDLLDTLRDTRTALEGKLETLQQGMLLKRLSLTDAVRDVAREECGEKARTLVEELHRLHRHLVDKHIALAYLVANEFVADYGPAALDGIGELTSRFTYAPEQWRAAHMPIPSPSRNAWAAAIEALKTDAMAQLPEVI